MSPSGQSLSHHFLWVSPFHSVPQCSPRAVCTGCWECRRVRAKTGTCESQGASQAKGGRRLRIRTGGICSYRALPILFEAILLFLVLKALCSLVHCFNCHQEISPCSGSVMPVVPACGRPGGKWTGLFQGWSFRVRIVATLSPFVTHPVCTGGEGEAEREMPVSLFFFIEIVAINTYFYVKGKMLKSRSQ